LLLVNCRFSVPTNVALDSSLLGKHHQNTDCFTTGAVGTTFSVPANVAAVVLRAIIYGNHRSVLDQGLQKFFLVGIAKSRACSFYGIAASGKCFSAFEGSKFLNETLYP
jgi:hypothetical protein